MKIKCLQVGPIGTNCYLLCDEDAKTCAVIDPGDQPEDIDREIRKAGLTLTMILITHGHFDHADGLRYFLEENPTCKVYARPQAAGPYFSTSTTRCSMAVWRCM